MKHSVFIIEFVTGHFQEITCKPLRKSMLVKKVGQMVLVTLINTFPYVTKK